MPYPLTGSFTVQNIFGEEKIDITFNSGLTLFVGPNASGKTQTMKAIKAQISKCVNHNKIRYLSSNRIGMMEQYRNQVSNYYYGPEAATFGSSELKQNRRDVATVEADFMTMDVKKDVYIKVCERLSVLFSRQLYLEWDNGQLKVKFENTISTKIYSAASEASGLINLVSILAALYDDDIKILFIDEPEVSLHPQLQAFLLQEIKKASGAYEDSEEHRGKKMIILSTHSTEMIDITDPTDIVNYLFFVHNSKPKQIDPNEETLKNGKLQEFILRMGYSYKASFFAKKVLLVEGISDYMMCKYFNARFQYNLESAGVQLIPVEGKGQFPIVSKFMRLIGKEVILLTDIDAFTDDNHVINLFSDSEKAKSLAALKSHPDMQTMVRTVKNSESELSQKIAESDENWFEVHPYWINRNTENLEIAKRRAIISSIFNDTANQSQKFTSEIDRVKLQLNSLFDNLEKLGCFILRKGALESYYIFAQNGVYDGKPSEAIEEINYLKNQSDQCIQDNYEIFIRLLKFASNKKVVDESNAVRQELLSEISAIVDWLKQKTEDEIKQIIDENSMNDIALSMIRKLKKADGSFFRYKLLQTDKISIEVEISSKIMEVKGFPLTISIDDNINDVIYKQVRLT